MDELARFRLDGRVALVAGGSGGIGARACAALASVGARVAVVGRAPDRLARARDAVEAAGSEAIAITGDMASKADADRAVAETVAGFGRLDILVNAIGGGAGTALYGAKDGIVVKKVQFPAPPKKSEDLVSAFEAGITPRTRVILVCHITNLTGQIFPVRGQLGIDAGYSAYVAAKGALNALTRQHATEWAKHGITVNAISPTFVRVPQTESLLADQAFYDRLVARIPLRRIADTDDLVGAILFFCSDASAFVTGQVLTLDGGLTATQ